MFRADLALLAGWQLYLVSAGELRAEALFLGPLGASAVARGRPRPLLTAGSATRCLVVAAMLLPAIHRENGRTQSVNELVSLFNTADVYSYVQVMATALYMLAAYAPTIDRSSARTTFGSVATTLVLMACVNYNVAAAFALCA